MAPSVSPWARAAKPMDEWTVYLVTEPEIKKLAER